MELQRKSSLLKRIKNSFKGKRHTYNFGKSSGTFLDSEGPVKETGNDETSKRQINNSYSSRLSSKSPASTSSVAVKSNTLPTLRCTGSDTTSVLLRENKKPAPVFSPSKVERSSIEEYQSEDVLNSPEPPSRGGLTNQPDVANGVEGNNADRATQMNGIMQCSTVVGSQISPYDPIREDINSNEKPIAPRRKSKDVSNQLVIVSSPGGNETLGELQGSVKNEGAAQYDLPDASSEPKPESHDGVIGNGEEGLEICNQSESSRPRSLSEQPPKVPSRRKRTGSFPNTKQKLKTPDTILLPVDDTEKEKCRLEPLTIDSEDGLSYEPPNLSPLAGSFFQSSASDFVGVTTPSPVHKLSETDDSATIDINEVVNAAPIAPSRRNRRLPTPEPISENSLLQQPPQSSPIPMQRVRHSMPPPLPARVSDGTHIDVLYSSASQGCRSHFELPNSEPPPLPERRYSYQTQSNHSVYQALPLPDTPNRQVPPCSENLTDIEVFHQDNEGTVSSTADLSDCDTEEPPPLPERCPISPAIRQSNSDDEPPPLPEMPPPPLPARPPPLSAPLEGIASDWEMVHQSDNSVNDNLSTVSVSSEGNITEPTHMSLEEMGFPERRSLPSSAALRNTENVINNLALVNREIVSSDEHEYESVKPVDFAESMNKLKECGWYWGPLSYEDSATILEGKVDGSFLLRDSASDTDILTVVFRVDGETHHTRLHYHNGMFSFFSMPYNRCSSSIVELMEHIIEDCRSRSFQFFLQPNSRPAWNGEGAPPLPIAMKLLYPVSRFSKLTSLKHQCRFLILKHVRRDLIDQLPLPRTMKQYLQHTQYYTEHLPSE